MNSMIYLLAMSRTAYILAGISYYVVCTLIIVIGLSLISKKYRKRYQDEINILERDKNLIISSSILSELNKVEALVNNEKLQESYDDWQKRFKEIKDVEVPKITDALIEIEGCFADKDYKALNDKIAKAELEIFYLKTKANFLLDEIKEITLSEERNRDTITKLKTKYREIITKYNKNKNDYKEVCAPLELQFENVDKLFAAFEVAMEANSYEEVGKIVKGIDDLVGNLAIVCDEAPTIILMGKNLIPNKMKEIKAINARLVGEGYNLDYLNLDYNISEAEKKIQDIFARLNVLNVEDSIFELKTILDYLDSIFVDFEKERLSRKVYEEIEESFNKKVEKTNKVVDDIYSELHDIKNMYDLNEEDVKTIHDAKKTLVVINDDYKNMVGKVGSLSVPYSVLHKDVESLTERLKKMEEDLDISLKSLGNMHDDEERAREQLDEIENFLQESKTKMRSFKLPVITDDYFIQLKEANEAIEEVIKELEKKPIVIKVLNTRVDTARDLVLKLYNTTNEMIKTAILAEKSIVYGNRYKPYYDEVEEGLDEAEEYFYKGEYKKSLDTVLKTCSLVDENIYTRLLAVYDK